MLNPREILFLPLGSAIVDRGQSAALKVTVESHDSGASFVVCRRCPLAKTTLKLDVSLSLRFCHGGLT
jgi:hypothetical protein